MGLPHDACCQLASNVPVYLIHASMHLLLQCVDTIPELAHIQERQASLHARFQLSQSPLQKI